MKEGIKLYKMTEISKKKPSLWIILKKKYQESKQK